MTSHRTGSFTSTTRWRRCTGKKAGPDQGECRTSMQSMVHPGGPAGAGRRPPSKIINGRGRRGARGRRSRMKGLGQRMEAGPLLRHPVHAERARQGSADDLRDVRHHRPETGGGARRRKRIQEAGPAGRASLATTSSNQVVGDTGETLSWGGAARRERQRWTGWNESSAPPGPSTPTSEFSKKLPEDGDACRPNGRTWPRSFKDLDIRDEYRRAGETPKSVRGLIGRSADQMLKNVFHNLLEDSLRYAGRADEGAGLSCALIGSCPAGSRTRMSAPAFRTLTRTGYSEKGYGTGHWIRPVPFTGRCWPSRASRSGERHSRERGEVRHPDTSWRVRASGRIT